MLHVVRMTHSYRQHGGNHVRFSQGSCHSACSGLVHINTFCRDAPRALDDRYHIWDRNRMIFGKNFQNLMKSLIPARFITNALMTSGNSSLENELSRDRRPRFRGASYHPGFLVPSVRFELTLDGF
jgi:hypothetical protein